MIAALLLLAAAPPAAPHVAVTGGRVEGIRTADRLVFRGIPFAAPPLADRRWRAPAPVAAWKGVRRATAAAPACLQNDEGWNHADHVGASEDCLTLDVGTPSLTGKRPVLVWIHGGSNRAGSPQGMVESSILRHGIVIVGVRYRLGIFGFLAHRSFGPTGGNYALMDQIAALRWVRDNIARFGGDPARVTIAGESAGAQDVGSLQLAPAARGLFAGAIMESGTPGFGIGWRPLAEAWRIGDQLDALLGGADPRSASAAALLAADGKLHDDALAGDAFMWLRPTIDGAVLPDEPTMLLRSAPAHPLLIGTNAYEFDLPGGRGWRDAFLRRSYGADADRARAFYQVGNGRDPAADPRLGTVDQRIATDAIFRCPTERFAALTARRGAPVWRYLFDGPPVDGRSDAMTGHAKELPYIFGEAALGGVPLQDYWARFIVEGDPGGGWPRWPQRMRFDIAGVRAESTSPDPVCALADTL